MRIKTLFCCFVIAFALLQSQATAQCFQSYNHSCYRSCPAPRLFHATRCHSRFGGFGLMNRTQCNYGCQPLTGYAHCGNTTVHPYTTGLDTNNPTGAIPLVRLPIPERIQQFRKNKSNDELFSDGSEASSRKKIVFLQQNFINSFGVQSQRTVAVEVCQTCYDNCISDPVIPRNSQGYCTAYCQEIGDPPECPTYVPFGL